MDRGTRKKLESQMDVYITAEIEFMKALSKYNKTVRELNLPKSVLTKLDSMNSKIDKTTVSIVGSLSTAPKPRIRRKKE